MNTLTLPIDFRELARRVQDTNLQWGRARVAIWGGTCSTDEIQQFLCDWPDCDQQMPYRIWETTLASRFAEKTLPDSYLWLEYGRLFGPGGDLTIRRHEQEFLWHFVGMPQQQPPKSFVAHNFWTEENATFTYFCQEETALLWGERKPGQVQWFDNQTGNALLEYPSPATGRLQVRYRTFSNAGQIEFVWLLGVEAYHG